MSRRTSGQGLVVVVALAVGLITACTPAGPLHPTPTASSQGAPPAVRVPVKCAQLFSTEEASLLVGYNVTVKADESTTPTDISSIAARQHGTLVCIWGSGGSAGELAGYANQLEIDVAVDASGAYEKNVPALDATDPPMYVNTAGDKSGSSCEVEDFFGCGGEMLVGNYWVSIELQNEIFPTTISASDAGARIQHALATVGAALNGTEPTSRWRAPASTLPSLCSSPGTRVKLQHILGLTHLKSSPFTQTAANAFYLAASGRDNASCQWRDNHVKMSDVAGFDEVDFQIVSGGGWALPALLTSPRTDITWGTYRPVTLAGSSAAVVNSCVPGCSAIVAIRGNVVQIGLQPLLNTKLVGPSREKATKTLVALVEAIKAS